MFSFLRRAKPEPLPSAVRLLKDSKQEPHTYSYPTTANIVDERTFSSPIWNRGGPWQEGKQRDKASTTTEAGVTTTDEDDQGSNSVDGEECTEM